MKKLSLVALAFAAFALHSSAAFINHQAALSVLGQPNFTAALAAAVSPTTCKSPEGVAIDPTSGKVFVSDSANYRILRFDSIKAYTTGAKAEAVFGQPNFFSNLPNRGGTAAANTVGYPASICVDSAGRLWMADETNYRILRFDHASTKPALGATADAVLGQPDFTTATQPASAGQGNFHYPTCVAVDSTGTLWVSDYDYDRVLKFTNAPAKANGANADAVLGQASFTTSTGATTATGMKGPYGVSVDTTGHLWVADSVNNRVLRFDNAKSKGTGASANGVLGQPDFTSNLSSAFTTLDATTMDAPYYVTAGTDGTVWVADYNNNRVLGFRNAASNTNGSADIVLGQATFTTKASANGPQGLSAPAQIATVGTNTLFVAVYGQSRVLRFGPAPAATLTAPASVTARRGIAHIRGTSTNAASVTYNASSGASFKKTLGKPAHWKIVLRHLKKKITRVKIRAYNADGAKVQKVVRVKSS